MGLDRGSLAKIDRKVFAELDHADGVQAVKVPVSDAVWSAWRRYCEAMGLSMGNGVAGLILDELESVVDGGNAGVGVFARQAEERVSDLDARERELDTRAERMRAKEEYLRGWEQRLRTKEVISGRVQTGAKVGRNERCPCRSGLKYKHCHGLPGRSE